MSLADKMTAAIARYAKFVPPRQAGENAVRRFTRRSLLAPVNRMVYLAIPFAGRTGFQVTELEAGLLRARMPLKGNRNHIGSMYAGALFTLAEIPGGVMTIFDFGADYIPVLKSLEMTYLKMARTDIEVVFRMSERERVELKARVDTLGKTEFVLEGVLTDSGGNEVARSRALYQMRLRGH